jgi:flagellar biogenesis protein FliO
MKKFTETLKSLSKGKVEGSSMPTVLMLVVTGLAIIIALPLLLIWGLQLIGLPIEASFSSWFGSILILIFIKIASAKSETTNNQG